MLSANTYSNTPHQTKMEKHICYYHTKCILSEMLLNMYFMIDPLLYPTLEILFSAVCYLPLGTLDMSHYCAITKTFVKARYYCPNDHHHQ